MFVVVYVVGYLRLGTPELCATSLKIMRACFAKYVQIIRHSFYADILDYEQLTTVITGWISAKRQIAGIKFYPQAENQHFRPVGATRCTDSL